MGLLLKKFFVLFKKPVFLCLFLTTFLYGCGSSDENKVNFAITKAEILLSSGSCTEALKVLNEIGNQKENARYLMTLASAYACRGGYSTLGVFENLGTFSGSFNLNNPFGPLTNFTTAELMTTEDDVDFLNLQSAINTLIYAGGIPTSNNPVASTRASYFNTGDALDINIKLFYMLFDQLSRFGYYYGCYDGVSGSSDITKGKGRASGHAAECSNECFANYNEADTFGGNVGPDNDGNIGDYLDANVTGDCDGGSEGHSSLAASNGAYSTLQVEILCEGVVIMNNFREVLGAISDSLSSIPGFEAIGNLNSAFQNSKAWGDTAGIGSLMNTMSQTQCESFDNKALAIYYVLFFETLFR